MPKKLNLGCGTDIRPDCVNLDKALLPGVDVAWDLQNLPLPFKDEEFDTIYCQDVIEHLAYIPVLRELHRIVKKGGEVIIRVAHFTSVGAYADPTHRSLFAIASFDFFVKNNPKEYYFDFTFDHIRSRHIKLERQYLLYGTAVWELAFKVAERFFNASPQRLAKYEKSFLSRLLPASAITVTLIK